MLATRWQPFGGLLSEMSRMQHDMDRLAEHWGVRRSRPQARGAYPALNLWEDDNSLHVEAELPGLSLEHLEIYVSGDNELMIKGQRVQPDLQEAAWHRQERGYGEFARVVELPEVVDADKVTAELKHGVLTISLPKKEEVKPRRIEIRAS